jgi:chromosome segregation ATPase
VKEQPTPISHYVPDLPPEVNEIFERMTAKQPGDRVQTMADVAAALEPFAERHRAEVDLRALLHARSTTYSREDIQAMTTPGSVLSDLDMASKSSQTSLSGLSHIRKLEDGVRRIADELTNQRAENQRLLDRLESNRSERKQFKLMQAEINELKQKLQQLEEERTRQNEEADRERKVVADLRARCGELENTVESYRQQLEKMSSKARELTSAVDSLQPVPPPTDEVQDALRSAYEEASPHEATEEELIEDVWAEQDLFGLPPESEEK